MPNEHVRLEQTMTSQAIAILLGCSLVSAFAADPVVDKAIQDAQKKYPAGDYDRPSVDRPGNVLPIFEIHAVAPKVDATRKWYSYDRGDGSVEKLALEPEILLDQRSIKAAWVEHDAEGLPVVWIKLTAAGAQKFGEITEKLINKRFAIVFQGHLISAPVIRSVIYGGDLMLHAANENEAAEMAAKLNP